MTEDRGSDKGGQGLDSASARRMPAWLVAAAGVGAAIGLLGAVSLGMAYLSTHPRRRRLRRTPAQDAILHDNVTFASRDGLRLAGWFIPGRAARATIVLCHGFPNNRSEMMTWVRMLRPLPVNLLLFDFRALGDSEGDLCTIGYHEVQDLLGAVDYLERRADCQGLPTGVFGLSMGGAVALMAAAQDARIRAVATHGAYATLDDAIDQRCRVLLGPFRKALSSPAKWWGRRWFPVSPVQVSPLDAIRFISPRPVLLFHGERDLIARVAGARKLYAAAGRPRDLRILRQSRHARIHPAEAAGYAETLRRFFASRLLRGAA